MDRLDKDMEENDKASVESDGVEEPGGENSDGNDVEVSPSFKTIKAPMGGVEDGLEETSFGTARRLLLLSLLGMMPESSTIDDEELDE